MDVHTIADWWRHCFSSLFWFTYFSLITFFCGLIIILSWKLIRHFINTGLSNNKPPSVTREDNLAGYKADQVGCMTRLKWMAEECISGQTVTGRILVSAIDISMSIILLTKMLMFALTNNKSTHLFWGTTDSWHSLGTSILKYGYWSKMSRRNEYPNTTKKIECFFLRERK